MTTSLRLDPIFYKSKLKLINFVMTLYCLTEQNRTNVQINNKVSLPQENYKDTTRSSSTVIQYYYIYCSMNIRKMIINIKINIINNTLVTKFHLPIIT